MVQFTSKQSPVGAVRIYTVAANGDTSSVGVIFSISTCVQVPLLHAQCKFAVNDGGLDGQERGDISGPRSIDDFFATKNL